MFDDFVRFVRELYSTSDFIPLHRPYFIGNEKQYLLDTIDSTYVSSVGAYVDEFEQKIADFTGAKYAIATVNGTAALHVALKLAGVEAGDEVITQSLTFIATCNAIRYCGAKPVFVDVDRASLGLSPESLGNFLDENAELRDDGLCWNKKSGRIIRACVPMHTFGFPARLTELNNICARYNINLVEDAAESLGSLYKGHHTGKIGLVSALSFNGNKIITTGGGGMILTDDEAIANHARHITTTAKLSHPWFYEHDETAFNYRLPNLNAALGVAQIESLPDFIDNKRQVAVQYQEWGEGHGVDFTKEPPGARANYWLNVLITKDKGQRDAMLEFTNANGVMTRPAWTPMHKLIMNRECVKSELTNTEWLFERLVNVPSSVVLNAG